MKCLFIINPVSGTKSLQKKINRFMSALTQETDVNSIDVYYTEREHGALKKAESLEKGQFDFVVAVGGDGTVNEVVTGIIHSGSDIPLAIIPAGTVNDFGNYLNIPVNPRNFAKMIKKADIQPVDVGEIDGRCFINVVSGGMFSDIGFKVTKDEKNAFGPLAYYLTGLRNFNEEIQTKIHLTVKTEKEQFEEDACLFLVTNSSFVGGFRDIAPLASVQDGEMDLLIIKQTDVLDLISIFKDYTLFFENHLDHPSVRYLQSETISIECDQKIVYDIDGEKGEHFPIEIKCLKHAIRMYVNNNDNI